MDLLSPCWQDSQDWLIQYHVVDARRGAWRARLEVDPSVAELPELSLLVTLGWYLSILRWSEGS